MRRGLTNRQTAALTQQTVTGLEEASEAPSARSESASRCMKPKPEKVNQQHGQNQRRRKFWTKRTLIGGDCSTIGELLAQKNHPLQNLSYLPFKLQDRVSLSFVLAKGGAETNPDCAGTCSPTECEHGRRILPVVAFRARLARRAKDPGSGFLDLFVSPPPLNHSCTLATHPIIHVLRLEWYGTDATKKAQTPRWLPGKFRLLPNLSTLSTLLQKTLLQANARPSHRDSSA